MNKYNPHIHHRRSIRLKGYDYAQAGLYFITICVQDRECLFGKIENGKMILNDAGRTVEKWYYELENKFSDIRCHETVVMPNHFHCIIENVGSVGADLRVCPDTNNQLTNVNGQLTNTNNQLTNVNGQLTDTNGQLTNANGQLTDTNNQLTNTNGQLTDTNNQLTNTNGQSRRITPTGEPSSLGEHIGSPLHRVVQWFKTMTTNEYIRGVKQLGWKPFNGKLWQRNYYEHIIRDEKSYQNISNYIINNPAKWTEDKFMQN